MADERRVTWQTACDTSSCVDVLVDGDRVLVRNSQRPEHIVEFTREEWRAFLDGVKRGTFDPD